MKPTPIKRRGLMFVLSSPSGAGKTTLAKGLLEAHPDMAVSISVTTRLKRPNEKDGEDYYFIDTLTFKEMINKGDFLEYAEVFGNHYGTPKAKIEELLQAGIDVLFDVDWQGAYQLAQKARADMVSVFILPPSLQELERRLRSRAEDSEEVVLRRMAKAENEISHWREYDYVVVNQTIVDSLAVLKSILRSERLRRSRQVGLEQFIHHEVLGNNDAAA